jgi:hypothetical protein
MLQSSERAVSTARRAAVWRGYPVPLLLGILLIVAAGFKAHELIFEPAVTRRFWDSRWLVIALTELELGLGLWLISGIHALPARRTALACFAAFAAVNGFKVWGGEASCGCFGRVLIPPAYILIFDLSALTGLWFWKPKRALHSNPTTEATALLESTERSGVASPGWWTTAIAGGGVILLAAGVTVRAFFQPADELFRQVTAEPGFFDFGEVPQGQSLTHIFRLDNKWRNPIEVVKVQSSCGCTTVEEIVGRVVGPGQSLEVPVTLHSGDSDGERSGTITVYYREPGQSIPAYKSVRVLANVITDYWVRPTLLDFGIVEDVEPMTRLVRLRPNRLADVRITSVDTDHIAFSARQVEAPSGSGDLHVQVSFTPNKLWRSGSVNSVVRLHTASERVPTTIILAQAQFRAPVEVLPAAVVVGADVTGPVDREIRVTAHRPVRVVALRCPQLGITLEASGTVAAKEHRVRVGLPGQETGQGLNTEVQLEIDLLSATGVTEARTVTIPVHRLPPLERMVVR